MATVTVDNSAMSNGMSNGHNKDETAITGLCDRCIVAFNDYILLLRMTDRPNRYVFDVREVLRFRVEILHFPARNCPREGAYVVAKVFAFNRRRDEER